MGGGGVEGKGKNKGGVSGEGVCKKMMDQKNSCSLMKKYVYRSLFFNLNEIILSAGGKIDDDFK